MFDYTLAFLNNSPVLQKEIASTTRSEIRLKNGINIAIHANSFRSVRGRTLCACIFDEVSYWRDDTTATPDAEVYSAVLPALITTNGMLIGISSPYRRLGLMYTKHKRFFGARQRRHPGGAWPHAHVQQDARPQCHRRPAASRSRGCPH